MVVLPRRLIPALLALAVLAAAPAADARYSAKKGIWGPARVDGVSQFPIYRELGAGLYHARLRWSAVAADRPADPGNPADPAYHWPAALDDAVALARKAKIRVAIEVAGSPRWANGGRTPNFAPDDPADYARFLQAAVRRYPGVRYWVIWGEPTRRPNFMPLPTTRPDEPLTAAAALAPERYARILDAAYGAIKRVSRRALVVGGNSFTAGDIGPRNWIQYMRLPNGRPPRMDLYGHNPFTARRPDLSGQLIRQGMADFNDLDYLARLVDGNLGRRPGGGKIKLFLGEYAIPTDHRSWAFNFWVSRKTQASWMRDALRIVRRWNRIEALVYFQLYDQRPRRRGDEMRPGLIDARGRRKPAFRAFRRG